MNNDRELLQQALDALQGNWRTDEGDKAIEAIRTRLAQHNEFNPDWDAVAVMVEEQQRMAKELKTQREWKGLTDEEIGSVIEASQITLKNYCSEEKQAEFARAIEAKLRRKNEQPCLF